MDPGIAFVHTSVPFSDQREEAIRAPVELDETSVLGSLVALVEGPEKPRIEAVVTRPVGHVGDPWNQLGVDQDAWPLCPDMIQPANDIGPSNPRGLHIHSISF
jgi:hypothetical protein